MPAWSTEIAYEFIKLADSKGLCLDQLQLQQLVYIAHGWRLAGSGDPLTGDRPEAWKIGPIYTRMATELGYLGAREVKPDSFLEGAQADLTPSEMDLIVMTLRDFGRLSSRQLSRLTQGTESPWSRVYADGAGAHREIAHRLIREQFIGIAQGEEKDGEPIGSVSPGGSHA